MSQAGTDAVSGMAPGNRLPGWINMGSLGPPLALVVLIIFGAIVSPAFLSFDNVINVLGRSAFIGIIAVGMTFVLTAGGLDLSVGSMAALIAGLMIMVMNIAATVLGVGWATVLVGMGTGLLLGLAAGVFNGFLVTRGSIDALIVTLGTMGIFRSLVTFLADGGTISLDFALRATYRPVYYEGILGITWPIIAFAVVAIVGEIVLRRTSFGRHCAAVGSSETVARYSAIHVANVQLITYVITGLCVAVAMLLYVPRLGTASTGTGQLWALEAIAAVVIGGTLLKGGFGRVWGSVIGVIILSIIGNILNLTAFVSPYLNGAFQGAIIIIAVYLQRSR